MTRPHVSHIIPGTAILVLAVVSLVPFPGVVLGADIREPTTWTGVKAGVLFPGNLEAGDVDADQKTSFCFQFFSDFPMGDHLHYGPTIEVLRMDWTSDNDSLRLGSTELMLDLSLNVKAMVPLPGDRVAIRPGFGIGYGVMKRRQDFNGTNYLTLKVYSELAFMLDTDRALIIDGGLWYVPVGGDSETDIRIGPLAFLRAGISF